VSATSRLPAFQPRRQMPALRTQSTRTVGKRAPVATSRRAGTAPRAAGQRVDSREAGPFTDLINKAGAKYGLDPSLLTAVARVESGLNPAAVSGAGAKGLMQLMDGTANALGVDNPFDAAENIDGGAHFLSEMLQRFKRPDLALAAYNAGPGAVSKYGGVPPYRETQTYVRRVLDTQRKLLA
jgi:soluble lytic murein transglycosylase-like protein